VEALLFQSSILDSGFIAGHDILGFSVGWLETIPLPNAFTRIGTNEHESGASGRAFEQPIIHIVSGHEQVLRLNRCLVELSARCGQHGTMDDLAFFLTKPGAMPRIPYLLLVSKTPELDLKNPKLDDLLGALLIFEQNICGIGVGAFATNDRSGRSTLIAMAQDRTRVVALCIRALMKRGAHLILMSYRAGGGVGTAATDNHPLLEVENTGVEVACWAQRKRTIAGYLPLLKTFDATLARIGQRTRSNLRYYRRRAEADLGCVFFAQIEATREEVLRFNRQCMYAVPASVAKWRYDSLKALKEPVFMGMKDREGHWLSILGGRRYGTRSEILWQMNRSGHATSSLGTVMRSYCIDHEIAHGSRRLYIEGGTPHPIKFSFVTEELTDLVVMRPTIIAKVMHMAARRWIAPDNDLSHMLDAKDLEWRPC